MLLCLAGWLWKHRDEEGKDPKKRGWKLLNLVRGSEGSHRRAQDQALGQGRVLISLVPRQEPWQQVVQI